MNLDALPNTVLIIMVEFSVGTLIAALIADARGMVPAGFVKLSGVIVVAGVVLALLASVNVSGTELEEYRLRADMFGPIRGATIAFLVLSIMYAWAVLAGSRGPSFAWGGLALGAGLVTIGLLAWQVSAPAWSYAGVLLSFLAGALALGFVTEAMVLGHWYLVTPRLAGQPLQELTFLLLCLVVVQGVLMIVNASIPASEVPESSAVLAGSLGSNPAFWLRAGVGMAFPIALSYMSWRSSLENAMMSATGLLYIAVGAVFVGEVLARGLMFVTASPV